MTTTNDLNIKNNGIPIFNTASGSFSATVPPENQALVGGANGTILGVDPTGHEVGNPLCNTGVGTPPNYSATPTVDNITIINLPSQPSDGANKQYVDSIASSFTFLDSAICASTANLAAIYANGISGVGATLTNAGPLQAFSVDNYSPIATNRVLIKNQTNAYENGVYEVTTAGDSLTAWILTRTLDYDAPSEIIPGSLVSVLYGDTQAETFWAQTQNVVTIGLSEIKFIQFNAAGTGYLLAANNLSDVQDVATSRNNLGLTNVATQNVTQYSVLVGDASDGIVSLPTGASGQVLTSGGPGVNPTWLPVSGGTGFSSINVQTFSTAGTYTYTPSPNMQYCIVELLGAGGGATVASYNGGTSVSYGTGGAGGAYAKSLYNAATIGTSQTVIIGARGTGATNQTNANNGTNSSFGTFMTANGGQGGNISNTVRCVAASATGGNICNIMGNNPISNIYIGSVSSSRTIYPYFNGQGASSFYGTGGYPFLSIQQTPTSYGFTANGNNATGNGAGGGAGGWTLNAGGYPTPPPAFGGNGTDGLCIITEFIGG